MPTSPYLGFNQLTPNQTGKEVTINTALLAVEAAMNGVTTVDMSAGDVTLSVAQFTGSFVFQTTGLTVNRTLFIPATVFGSPAQRLFTVQNPSGFQVKVQIVGGAGGFSSVNSNDAFILYADGAGNIKKALSTFSYNDENAQDAVGLLIAAGTQSGITVTYDDAGGALNFTVAPYTNEMAQDAIASLLTDDGGMTLTYDDAGNLLKLRNSRFVIPFWFEFTPNPDECLGRYIATDAFTIKNNFVGSKAGVQVAPTADYVITVTRQVNATGVFATIGTITFHTDGTVTFATSYGGGGVDVPIAANDVIKFVAQHTTDPALLGGAVNIRGY
jgi:hypothetical protein